MDGTEVTRDVTQLLVIYDAHESDGETTLGRLGRGDFSRVLTTRQKDMEFLQILAVEEGRDRGRAAGLHKFKDSHWS